MYKNGKHILTKYWQDWKLNQPDLTSYQLSILIGMILSDACIIKTGKYPYIKFEQGFDQKEFVENLFDIFKTHTFCDEIKIRKINNKIHSYYFKTFSHPTFIWIYDLFYIEGNKNKIVKPNTIIKYVDNLALAYWIMSDGSLHKRDKIYTLHTGGFTYDECVCISNELNIKFNLHSSVKIANKSNKISYMIVFKSIDTQTIKNIIQPNIISIFKYKI